MANLELSLFGGNVPGLRPAAKRGIKRINSDGIEIKEFSVYDTVNVVCGKNIKNCYGRVTIFNLIKDGSEHKAEVESLLSEKVKFKGQGQRYTPSMTIEGLQRLLMILGGKVAKAFRDNALQILQRYLDGDMSLCKEVEENKNMGKKRSYAKFMNTVLEDAKKTMDEELKEIPSTAYIYATYSEAFPGLLKIGRSKDVKARLSSANTFTAPAPHRLLCMAPTFDAVRDEAATHVQFAKFRREGEFFEVEGKDVEAYFTTVITSWYQHELAMHMNSNKGCLLLRDG